MLQNSNLTEIAIESIRRKTLTSAFSLTVGRIFSQMVTSIGGIILARILLPEMFGIFAVVNFVVIFIGLFSDLGLGAALIQKKETPTRDDLRTTFTIQQILMGFLLVIVFFASPAIVRWYKFQAAYVWLLRALSFSLFLTSFKSIPSVFLQRALAFNRLVTTEITEVFIFQVTAIWLAILGFGVWSFVWAVLLGSLASLVLLYILSPWKVSYGINSQSARRLIHFGAFCQLNNLINFSKDAVTPVLVGKICGAAGVGYFNWADKFICFSVFFPQIISRITFSAFPRIQSDKALLKKGVEKSIRLGAILFFPPLAMSCAFARPIIHYLYTDKWLPGLPVFYWLVLAAIVSGPMGLTIFNAFYAVGKPQWVMRMVLLYLGLNWLLGFPLILKFGFLGMAFTQVIIAYSTIGILLKLMNRIVRINFWGNILPFFFPAALAGAIFYLLVPYFVKSFFSFIFWGITGGVFCFLVMYIFNPGIFKEELKESLKTFLKKGP